MAWQAVPVCDEARLRLRDAGRRSGEDHQAFMARYRSAEYAEALRRIQHTVPPTEPVYLADLGQNEAYFLHFDLAPRPMVYAGTLEKPDRQAWLKTRDAVKARWVVIARLVPPGPELMPVADFFGSP